MVHELVSLSTLHFAIQQQHLHSSRRQQLCMVNRSSFQASAKQFMGAQAAGLKGRSIKASQCWLLSAQTLC